MLAAYLLACALGTGLHFVYGLWPNTFVGLFVPVNESVWEHLKLLFWPYLGGMWLLSRQGEDKPTFWAGALTGLLVMPPALLAAYYVPLGALALESHKYNILLYVLTMALGFYLAWRLWRRGRVSHWLGTLVMLSGIYCAMLFMFTVCPPELPVFAQRLAPGEIL